MSRLATVRYMTRRRRAIAWTTWASAVVPAFVPLAACGGDGDAEPPTVADASIVAYTSNPPSSGPHFDRWANF